MMIHPNPVYQSEGTEIDWAIQFSWAKLVEDVNVHCDGGKVPHALVKKLVKPTLLDRLLRREGQFVSWEIRVKVTRAGKYIISGIFDGEPAEYELEVITTALRDTCKEFERRLR